MVVGPDALGAGRSRERALVVVESEVAARVDLPAGQICYGAGARPAPRPSKKEAGNYQNGAPVLSKTKSQSFGNSYVKKY